MTNATHTTPPPSVRAATAGDAAPGSRETSREMERVVGGAMNNTEAMMTTHQIGTFQITRGEMRVTDPCYQRGTPGVVVLTGVASGDWNASVVRTPYEPSWGERVAEIIAVATQPHGRVPAEWEAFDGSEIGVDSGQAGFFDDAAYPAADTGDFNDAGSFYGRVCHATLNTALSASSVAEGAVASSGYGDGGYPLFVKRDGTGQVVAVRIVFIGPEVDSEDGDEFAA